MTVFIFSVVLLAVLGILIGILLGVAGKVFAVETDERVDKEPKNYTPPVGLEPTTS